MGAIWMSRRPVWAPFWAPPAPNLASNIRKVTTFRISGSLGAPEKPQKSPRAHTRQTRVLELRPKAYSNSSSREMPAQHGLGRTRSWAGPRMLLEVSVFPSRLGTYACAAWPRPSLQLCIVPGRLYYVLRVCVSIACPYSCSCGGHLSLWEGLDP